MTYPTFLPPPAFSRLFPSKSAPTILQCRTHTVCTTTRPQPSNPPPSSPPIKPAAPSNSPQTPPPAKPLSLLLLNLVTILWGTQHAVQKYLITFTHTSPASLNFFRFLLASVISIPFIPSSSTTSPKLYRHAFEQSLWLFLGYAMQSIALQTTSAARSGFLLYLNVKLVPLLAYLLYGRKIAPSVWASAFLALCGTALLTYDGSPPVIGDVWSVGAAAASAMFIVRLEKAAREVEAASLSAISLAGVAALSAIWTAAEAGFGRGGGNWLEVGGVEGWIGVVYLGVVTTALCNYLQILGQKGVAAERAAVVYAMDPVYGSVFAVGLLGEHLGSRGVLGAALVVVAAIWSGRGASRDGEGDGATFTRIGVGDNRERKEGEEVED